MELDITYKNSDKKNYKAARKIVKKAMQHYLEPHLQRFNPSHIRLYASMEQVKKGFNIVLHLNVPPRKVIVAKESAESLEAAADIAMKELSRQVEKHAAKISGREQWKRKERRKRMKQYMADHTFPLTEIQENLDQGRESLLSKIEHYIKRELAFLQASGDLPSNYPTVEDIRDEALLKVQVNWNKLDSHDETIYQSLLKAVTEILTNEVRQSQLHQDDVSLEDKPAKDAVDQAEEMVEEEIYEFYQPFEHLHVEDVIADSEASSPENQAVQDMKNISFQALSNLPIQWRRVLLLTHQEQLPIEVIANNIMPQSIEQIEKWCESAEQFIVTILNESGYVSVSRETVQNLLR